MGKIRKKLPPTTPEVIIVEHDPQIQEYDMQLRAHDRKIAKLKVLHYELQYKRTKLASEILNDPTYHGFDKLQKEYELMMRLGETES